jgi:hypothetical protein
VKGAFHGFPLLQMEATGIEEYEGGEEEEVEVIIAPSSFSV